VSAPVTTLPTRPPRSHQHRIIESIRDGAKRVIVSAGRRIGKTRAALDACAILSQERPGLYVHMLPLLVQGRQVVWDGIDDRREPMLSAFPRELIRSRNDSEMRLDLTNGGAFLVLGGDNVDRARGLNVAGICFDEWAYFRDAGIWRVIEPILLESKGWALFISTPSGKNHHTEMLEHAERERGWVALRLPVTRCRKDAPGEDGGPIIDPQEFDRLRKAGWSEQAIAQEFLAEPMAASEGAVYAPELKSLEVRGISASAARWR